MSLNHISHAFRAIRKNRFLTFESQLKKPIVQSSFYLQFKSETCLKYSILELNCVSDLAQIGEVRYIPSSNILAVNENPLENLP